MTRSELITVIAEAICSELYSGYPCDRTKCHCDGEHINRMNRAAERVLDRLEVMRDTEVA